MDKLTNLKADLSDYLSRNERFKNGLTIPIPIPQFDKMFNIHHLDIREALRANTTGPAPPPSSPLCTPLTRFQRFIGFCMFLCVSIFFYTLSAFYLPLLVLKARKFALFYTLGSTSFFTSIVILRGPVNAMKHLLFKNQWIFTIILISAFAATLYFAIWEHNTSLTVLFAIIQSLSLLQYLLSYIPTNIIGFSLFTRLFRATVGSVVASTVGTAINTTVQTTAATGNYICDFV